MAKGGRKAKGASSQGGTHTPELTAAQLFQQAQLALGFGDVDAGKSALKRAIKIEPNNSALWDVYASLLADLDDPGAKEALMHAVAVAPQSGFEKYMYLAQMEEDAGQALKYSSTGLALMQSQLDKVKGIATKHEKGVEEEDVEDVVQELSAALCGGLCAHAEMMLRNAVNERDEGAADSTLEVDSDAAAQIEALCAQAAQLQPHSPEPGQALASLRVEQGRSEEALTMLRASVALWWPPKSGNDDDEGWEEVDELEEGDQEGLAQASGSARGSGSRNAAAEVDDAMDTDEEDEGDSNDEDGQPSYEFRVECAKLLLELEEDNQLAVDILVHLVQEDDSNTEAQHLLGLALYSSHRYDESLEPALRSVTLLGQQRVPQGDDRWEVYQELVTAVREAMGHQAAAAGAAGIKGKN